MLNYMATIIIPTPLRKFTGNESKVEAQGATVHEAFQHLSALFPDLQKQLFDDEGELRSFLRIYKGSTDIRALDHAQTALESGTVLSIVPAIAGGSISISTSIYH
jgi:sulfur-carrier protein